MYGHNQSEHMLRQHVVHTLDTVGCSSLSPLCRNGVPGSKGGREEAYASSVWGICEVLTVEQLLITRKMILDKVFQTGEQPSLTQKRILAAINHVPTCAKVEGCTCVCLSSSRSKKTTAIRITLSSTAQAMLRAGGVHEEESSLHTSGRRESAKLRRAQ